MSTRTEALVCRAHNTLPQLEEVEIGQLRRDEVLVDICATGICHTDLACMSGKLPAPLPQVLGHEGAGIVVQVGADVTEVEKGDKVILSYNHCRECAQCTSDHPAFCDHLFALNFNGERLDGTKPLSACRSKDHFGNFFGQSSFARRALVNRSCVVKVPSDTPLDLCAPLGCGLQTGAGTVINVLKVAQGESVAIFGAGAVGLSALMVSKLRGADPIVAIDIHASRLELAKEFGATHTIDASEGNVVEHIRRIAPPLGTQHAVDTTAVVSVIETMVASLAVRGKAVSIGSPAPGQYAKVEVFSMINQGREYAGSTQGDSVAREMVPYLLDAYRNGRYPFDKLVKIYDLENYAQAFADMERGQVIKPVIRWS